MLEDKKGRPHFGNPEISTFRRISRHLIPIFIGTTCI